MGIKMKEILLSLSFFISGLSVGIIWEILKERFRDEQK